jgi:hypothetical protein
MADIKKETAGMFFLCFRIYPVNECVFLFSPFTLLQNVKWVKRDEHVFFCFLNCKGSHGPRHTGGHDQARGGRPGRHRTLGGGRTKGLDAKLKPSYVS